LIAAVPAVTPVTTPDDEPTVATPVAVLVQVPPLTVLVRVVVADVQTVAVPPMAAGDGVVVIVVLAEAEQLLAVAVMLYTLAPAAVGVIVLEAHGVQERPVAPPTPVHA
jgi:hypothetical protein